MKAERPTNGHEGDGFLSNDSRGKLQVDLLHFSHLNALRDVQFKAVVLK
jgi:hypothetical protein